MLLPRNRNIMVVLGVQATKIVAKAVLAAVAGKLVSDCLEWTVNNVDQLKEVKPIVDKVMNKQN